MFHCSFPLTVNTVLYTTSLSRCWGAIQCFCHPISVKGKKKFSIVGVASLCHAKRCRVPDVWCRYLFSFFFDFREECLMASQAGSLLPLRHSGGSHEGSTAQHSSKLGKTPVRPIWNQRRQQVAEARWQTPQIFGWRNTHFYVCILQEWDNYGLIFKWSAWNYEF